MRFINFGLFCIVVKRWHIYLLATNIKRVGLAKFLEACKNALPSSDVRNFWC